MRKALNADPKNADYINLEKELTKSNESKNK
ncbi:Putative membrane peptidase, contains TPR repeat domain [Staphylococcus aureus]|nr:Putative membrane peptidase, contains TPR repeat domain [Staphylococcus aureus]